MIPYNNPQTGTPQECAIAQQRLTHSAPASPGYQVASQAASQGFGYASQVSGLVAAVPGAPGALGVISGGFGAAGGISAAAGGGQAAQFQALGGAVNFGTAQTGASPQAAFLVGAPFQGFQGYQDARQLYRNYMMHGANLGTAGQALGLTSTAGGLAASGATAFGHMPHPSVTGAIGLVGNIGAALRSLQTVRALRDTAGLCTALFAVECAYVRYPCAQLHGLAQYIMWLLKKRGHQSIYESLTNIPRATATVVSIVTLAVAGATTMGIALLFEAMRLGSRGFGQHRSRNRLSLYQQMISESHLPHIAREHHYLDLARSAYGNRRAFMSTIGSGNPTLGDYMRVKIADFLIRTASWENQMGIQPDIIPGGLHEIDAATLFAYRAIAANVNFSTINPNAQQLPHKSG